MVNEKFETMEWKNEDLIVYYENVPIEVLHKYTVIGGFDEGCDIELVYPYIQHTQSIIEVGAGYGRAIKHLIRKGYTGKIYALERSKQFCNHLRKHYQNKADIIQADLKTFHPKQKADAILWLWSNISEFPKAEQFSTLKHLASWLKPNGIFVIETIHHLLIPKNATKVIRQSYVFFSEYGKVYGYIPSIKEIQEYLSKIGFKYSQHINYKTTTGRHRILHIFSYYPLVFGNEKIKKI